MIQSGDDDWIMDLPFGDSPFYSADISPPNKKPLLCALGASVVKNYFGQECFEIRNEKGPVWFFQGL